MTKLPPPSLSFSLTFFSFSLTLLSFKVISQPISGQLATLLTIRKEFKNPPALSHWNATSSYCDWPEIVCSGAGDVIMIKLVDYNIYERIPDSLCELKFLETIDFSLNYIPGEFPRSLYNCSKLLDVYLSQNCFTGQIPADIDRISTLKWLDLSANNFTGDIPPAIGGLLELRGLYLHSNLFNGTIPASIGNLSNLLVLGLAYNDFIPAGIPPEFGKLSNLTFLWMTTTGRVGSIPESFSGLVSLEHLDLSDNELDGKIPDGLFLLKNLDVVYLFKNKLSGSIPRVIESIRLTELDISMNNLTGVVPDDFGKLQELKILNMFSNKLSGEIPAGVGLLANLTEFRVWKNDFSGEFPAEFGLHSKLDAFEASENRFSGKLPENLCAGGNLSGVVVFSNNLTGSIPKSLGNCPTLRTVQLYNNNFVGEVPLGLWTSKNVYSLMLSHNSLSGELPDGLAWNVSRLEINDNKFSGKIPGGVSSWKNLVVCKASNNRFSGVLPIEITSLTQLTTLELDGNLFSGQLPMKIISWKSLNTLILARNNLSGTIPGVIGTLPNLLVLDLSENQLSGPIPTELGRLRLTALNLSSNELTGNIPLEFDNMAYDRSFLNSSKLCATTSELNLTGCYRRIPKSNKLSNKFLALILILAVVVLLATVVSTVLLIGDYRRKKLKRDLASWKLTSFQRLDFTEANILSSLTDSNMIGSGGSGKVYRIQVGRVGEYVAVKKIWSNHKLDHALEKEFLAEVGILGTIKHSNIIKLLCCISSDNSKLLVYEYMDNQSLDRWLHGKRRMESPTASSVHHFQLDWSRRMQIAVGAAQGLCYMHHDCSPPILHRDVKSSNILLDFEFQAKIADFGLAKILLKRGEANTMSTIAGSFGYIAPEYAYTTKVNEKIDVFSFGVVLLELVTGREPNDGSENINLAEWCWRHYGERKPIADILDKEIKKQDNLEEMIAIFKLGLVCTSTLPASRPSMREVLQILRNSSPGEGKQGKKGSEYDVVPLLGVNAVGATYLSSYRKSKKVLDDESSFIQIM
ncbi:uncharacterized protein LOC141675121 [Apium graveolens]|uniref:uncharacterized protein LOC141675121 n=1 Tax=Apium graveolens TaxID=4045 RepID=UPI003D79C7C5